MKLFSSTHTSQEEDSVLLRRYLHSNNLEVLGELYSRHTEMVYYVCLRYFAEPEKSEDAVMQIFEELIHKIPKQEIKDFPKWLYVVSKNFCLMDIRSRKSNTEISIEGFVESPIKMHPEENYMEKEERLSLMEQCLERLVEKQKVTIELFFLSEKCYREIVEITGYSMNDVKSYIQNGKRNLKNCMEKSDE